MIKVNIVLLSKLARIPAYQSPGAAGLDLSACFDSEAAVISMGPGEVSIIPCGFAIEIPDGFEAQVRSRSGLATKHGVTVVNSPGTVDSDYRGEVKVGLINLGPKSYEIRHCQRVAQLIVAPVERAVLVQVAELSRTPRSTGGFGSTG